MKFIKRIKITSLLVLTLVISPFAVHAGLITLSPTTTVTDLNDGDLITMDILMDFTAEATLGGGFDIVFDPLALAFQGLIQNPVGDPGFTNFPTLLSGLLSGWSIGDFNGLTGPANLGSVTFQVLSTMAAGTSVSTRDNLDPLGPGPFVSWITFTQMPVTYNSIDITRDQSNPPTTIPEPSTVILLGLGLLITRLKKSKNS